MNALATVADDQSEAIGFLSRPGSYGLSDGVVERIETHCSVVFLAADRAYKLKRAIRYASLDYTTRALRQAACEAELALNRRTAPQLYLGIRSITRDPGGALTFDGPGVPVDHVVVMQRFAQTELFDHMLDAGRMSPELMRALGAAIAHLHRSAEVTPRFGGSEMIHRVIADNDRELANVARALDGAAVGTLSSRARKAANALAELLDHRRAAGKVRRGHGDLRLANICLFDGRPTPFDCIEFSDEIGCIDVLYDVAFLLMDLHVRGRADLGNVLFNAYLDASPEIDGLKALPLFLALRAATRSYALAGSAWRQADPRQAGRLLAAARRHIDAGIAFLSPAPPLLIALHSGLDAERNELAVLLAGAASPAPGARLVRLQSQGLASWDEARGVLAAGCSVLVEGDFGDVRRQAAATALASQHSVPLVALSLGPVPAVLDQRLWQVLDANSGVADAFASAALRLKTERGNTPERTEHAIH